ncbi:MAG TPA: methyltransferase domain-containing protein [Sphingomicrobium sp.]
MMNNLAHVSRRRRVLRDRIKYGEDFELWEESCVPSYCHSNWPAAYVSWRRLFVAADLARSMKPDGDRVLDFGSSVGELGHLLPANVRYDYIESHEPAAAFLKNQLPNSHRTTLEDAPDGSYDQIFAIDSLEHNENYRELLKALVAKLAPGGVLILSGPTESMLYRIGRRIAGFEGHYHETNIHAIERAASELLDRKAARNIFPVGTLFRVTAWKRKITR